jgi:glucose-fructose oxidoreductase
VVRRGMSGGLRRCRDLVSFALRMKNPHSASRRSFLGQLSLGAAALALASRGRAQPPAAGRKLGVALVGLGGYSRGQLGPALRLTQHCELRGVVTGSKEKGLQWSKEYGFSEKNIYDYKTMGQLADNPDIDIVYVVTPNALHAEHAVAAAWAGKHVICEKPMATTVADCTAIIATCRTRKVKLSMGYRVHFDPLHRELKRVAQAKEFGGIVKMTGANGFRMGRKVWRADKALAGGGPLMDMGIYCVNEACLVMGEAAPIAVTAKEHPKTRPEIFSDVEEGLDWTMEFANGAKGEFMTSYNRNDGQFRVEAEQGWIDFNPAFQYGGLKVTTSKGPWDIQGVRSQQALQMDDFAICVRDNKDSIVPGEMGRRDMAIVEAIYKSAAAGGKRTEVIV